MSYSIIHCHSFFSFSDSVISPDRLLKRLQDCNINRIAITDHGNLHHIFRFGNLLQKNNITYFPGCEFYYVDDIKLKDNEHRKSYHLIVIAKSPKGLRNLYKLSSISYLDGFYYKPRIDFESLKQYNEDLVVSSACIQGKIGSLLLEDKYEEAKNEALKFKEVFNDRFYIELMPHALDEQVKANLLLIKLAKELNIKLVASNDCHLITREDAEYRRFLMLMSKASWAKTDEDLGKLDSISIMNENDLRREFNINHNQISQDIINEAINNTNDMLSGENFKLVDEKIKLPSYGTEQEIEKNILLLLYKSLKEKKLDNNKKYTDRVAYEFNVIKEAGFINYFLVVHELFDWCRKNNIFTGWGRGSAAGSLIAYLLGITKIDPLKFDLMFERFYNAGRKGIGAAPDIDSDFEDERRSEVIKHLEDKYGKSNISQICNISEMKIKTSIRDCARVLNIDLPVVNKITSDVEWDEFETLDQAIELNEKAKNYVEQYQQLFKYVRYFLNFPRHIGKHAAGIVISSENIGNVCPMMITKVKDELFSLSQFDKKDIANTGLIKFDILGLSTLTFLKYIINSIKQDLNTDIDIDKIDYNDNNIYKTVFCNALTDNVFQFESDGMKGYLQKMQPESFEDIIVLNSLFRPAGLISGSLDNYIQNKLQNKSIKTGIKELDEILSKTRYVIAFDEQKMQIVLKFGGYTLEEANYFRKHSDEFNTKDYLEESKKYKDKFITNAVNNGLTQEMANNIYNGMCGYAFCRAHSVAYSILGYLCAWFKYYYPLQFLKASFYMSKSVDDVKYNTITALKMAKQFNFKINSIDINKSKISFNFVNEDIYWGLANVKGISVETAKIIIDNQPFMSFNDFIKKCKSRKITKRVIQPLVLLGAFRNLPNYQQEIDEWYKKGKYKENIVDMMSKPLSQYETEYLGLVLDSNINRNDYKLSNCIHPDKIKDLPDNSQCVIVGYLVDLKILKSKSNKLYGKVFIVDDYFNNYELITNEKTIQYIESNCEIGNLVLCCIKKLDNNRYSLNNSQIAKL